MFQCQGQLVQLHYFLKRQISKWISSYSSTFSTALPLPVAGPYEVEVAHMVCVTQTLSGQGYFDPQMSQISISDLRYKALRHKQNLVFLESDQADIKRSGLFSKYNTTRIHPFVENIYLHLTCNYLVTVHGTRVATVTRCVNSGWQVNCATLL